jgi:hypothetical protein
MPIFLNLISKIVLSVFLLFSVYASFLTIYNGSENDSILRVYSDDEHGQVIRLQRMLSSDSIDAGGFKNGFYHYGQVYNSAAYGIIKLLEHFGFEKGDYQLSVLVLKMLSITSYVLSIILIYLVLKSTGVSEYIASIFALLLAVHSDYWGWATTIHPDTLQMCLLMLSILIFLKINNINLAILTSSFIIGMAFGTKYSGVFVSVFIAAVIVLQTFNKENIPKNNRINYFINISSWSIISFFFGWILLNPFTLSRFNRLLVDLKFQSQNLTSLGGGSVLNNNWLEWFFMFKDEYGKLISWVIFLGIASLFFEIIKQAKLSKFKNLIDNREWITTISLLISNFIGVLILLFIIKYREWRYAFHILPFILILSGYGINLLLKRASFSWLNLIIFISLLFFIFPKAVSNFELLAYTHKTESTNPYVAAGKWLKNKYDKNTRVLSGVYSYVDLDHFRTVEYTFDVTANNIKLFQPDIIFMNDSVPGRYVWKANGTIFKDKSFVYKKKWKDQDMVNEYGHLFLKLLSSDSNWAIVYETESVVIFERKKEVLYE